MKKMVNRYFEVKRKQQRLPTFRQVLGGPQFIAVLQQVMERLPDKYTLR